jgi:hypothetical protein
VWGEAVARVAAGAEGGVGRAEVSAEEGDTGGESEGEQGEEGEGDVYPQGGGGGVDGPVEAEAGVDLAVEGDDGGGGEIAERGADGAVVLDDAGVDDQR